jgi:phosphatidylserine/phosphatidylglycerophosphate/cardiolipin synthase-like enzyme
VVVDDWVTIGSSNLDRWAAKWNLEANQEIIGESFTLSVMDMFNRDLKNCQEITIELWKNRALTLKIKVWFWRYMGKLIAKIGLNGRK